MSEPYIFQAKPKPVYETDGVDAIFALVALVIGFCFWNWLWPRRGEYEVTCSPQYEGANCLTHMDHLASVAVTAFFILALAASLTYFHLKKVHLSVGAIVGVVLLVAGALPFTLFAPTPFFLVLFAAEMVGFLVWHAWASCKRVGGLDGYMITDALNQCLVVPLTHLGAWFAPFRALLKGRTKVSHVLIALLGLVVAFPLIALVVVLLMAADQGFDAWMGAAAELFESVDLGRWVWCLVFGLPVAFFAFGIWWAGVTGEKSGLTRDGTASTLARMRRLAPSAIIAPLTILVAVYILFFAAMGSYLFSAFTSDLPADYTYAEYARRGFFELAAVAGINFAVMGFAYLFARRKMVEQTGNGPASESSVFARYPTVLRVLGAALSLLTILLIATSISKMVLYISAYGLTQLRVYVLGFEAVLGLVFLLILVRHFVRYDVSRPIVVLVIAAILGMSWANIDKVVADWDVDHCLSGSTEKVDVGYLASLSDAALPALYRLADDSPALADTVHTALGHRGLAYGVESVYIKDIPWTSWNVQSNAAKDLGPS
ncbi:MAG: DUF4173 domain-containing protein [Propionibacteriaceae bacterium]|jgi:hypothetical protein|nr:DUF4173 domain-containing protein [Propionibacteriaceae bacterium]